MKFAYEDLSSEQFETLIVLLCQRILGVSVQGFAQYTLAQDTDADYKTNPGRKSV